MDTASDRAGHVIDCGHETIAPAALRIAHKYGCRYVRQHARMPDLLCRHPIGDGSSRQLLSCRPCWGCHQCQPQCLQWWGHLHELLRTRNQSLWLGGRTASWRPRGLTHGSRWCALGCGRLRSAPRLRRPIPARQASRRRDAGAGRNAGAGRDAGAGSRCHAPLSRGGHRLARCERPPLIAIVGATSRADAMRGGAPVDGDVGTDSSNQ